jgi:hypothetical protein
MAGTAAAARRLSFERLQEAPMMDKDPLHTEPMRPLPAQEREQPDPLLQPGRGHAGRIIATAVAIVAIVGLLIYGLTQEPQSTATSSSAPTAGSSATPTSPAPATTGQAPQSGAPAPQSGGQPAPANQGAGGAGGSAGQGAR